MTTSIKMRQFIVSNLILSLFALVVLASCNKPGEYKNNHHASSHSTDVLDKWMTLQLRLMRNATGVANHAFSRHFAYSGIAAFEALKPGLHGHDKWSDKWNGLEGLPVPGKSKDYYYPANVNAALAAINRAFFPNAGLADKAAIDSLELALNSAFATTQPQSLLQPSSNFGKAVAAAVFNWSETDGYKNASNAYTVPVGAGLWKPTPPAFTAPATPYWGNNRPIITGSTSNTQPAPTLAYSTANSSSFYAMVKTVYDASQNLTDDQKAMAIFWRDIPGVSSPGHWLSILKQVLAQQPTSLDRGAVAYALMGTAINDALISCFKAKYLHNLVRPVTYIREVMGYTNWNSFIGTPAHPEYVSAHSALSAAAADVLERLFDDNGVFTDHTYDYMNLPARTYPTFSAIAVEAGQSRLYVGIHYQQSIDAGLLQGRKVTANIFSNNH